LVVVQKMMKMEGGRLKLWPYAAIATELDDRHF